MTPIRRRASPTTRRWRRWPSRGRFGIRLGLGRTRALLRELGNPERAVRGALVGGTNGKGSVLALAARALRAAGLRVGTTPEAAPRHLPRADLRRRRADRRRRTSPGSSPEVLPLAERVARRHGPPTEFELLTAVVFAPFRRGPARRRASSRSVSAGGSTRPMPGTAAWPRSRTSTSTTWTGSATRSRRSPGRRRRSSSAATWRSPARAATALAVIRRRARRIGAPLTVVEPAPTPRLGPRRHRGRAAAASAGRGSACAAGTRPPTSRSPTRVLDALEAAGIAAVGAAARRAGYATATLAGPPGAADGRRPGRPARRRPQPGRRGGAGRGARRPAAVPRRGSADPRHGVDGRQGRRRRRSRRSRAPVGAPSRRDDHRNVPLDVPRACPPPSWRRWRGGRRGARARSPTVAASPIAAARPGARHRRGPVVVAGSLYLVGVARGHLVDDPALRDPEPTGEARS